MLTFLLIVLAGIFVSNVFAEGGKCPTCSNTLSYNYGAWTPYSADKTKHIRTITPYCTNCGLTLTSYPSTPESHKYGEKPRIIIEDKSEPSCRGTIIYTCEICDYDLPDSFSESHKRGNTCKFCNTYFPTHEEEAERYIGKSNEDSEEGEGYQDDAEGNEEIADNNLGEGESESGNSEDEYNNGVGAINSAGEENSNSEENLGLSDDELGRGSSENDSSEISIDNSQGYNNDSQINEDESRSRFAEVEDGHENAQEKLAEANSVINENQEEEGQNNETINIENSINESGEAGDPVKYTTGEYVSTSTDLQIDNVDPAISIIRNYKNFNESSFSFGKGWNFNYDTRIIVGIRSDYNNFYESLKLLLSDIELIFTEACSDYEAAMEAALKSKRLAELSVEAAGSAILHAENAKKAAENAKNFGSAAKINAGQAEDYANKAIMHLNNSRESAMNAINLGKAAENYAIEARKFAEKAKQKAESAINSANRAIEHANKTSKQSLKDRANNALERARNLKNRADDKYPAEQGN